MKEIVLPDSQQRHLNTVMGLYGCDVGIHFQVGGEGWVKVLHVVPEQSLAIGWKRFGVLPLAECSIKSFIAAQVLHRICLKLYYWSNAPQNVVKMSQKNSFLSIDLQEGCLLTLI